VLARFDERGSLDTSFGGDGFVTESGDTYFSDVVVQDDGKVVASGNRYSGTEPFAIVARYNADGSPDVTFDGDGVAVMPQMPLPVPSAAAHAVALAPGGKILAAGTQQSVDFTAWR